MSIMNGNYKFVSNNVKGMKASKKRLELLEYVRNNKSNIFFWHGKSSSCVATIGFLKHKLLKW